MFASPRFAAIVLLSWCLSMVGTAAARAAPPAYPLEELAGDLSPNGEAVGSSQTAGVIVGASKTAAGPDDGFVHSNGQMYDLNSLVANPQGYIIESAVGINTPGDIAPNAISPDGQYRAVLLTPTSIPVPAAAWAALTALPLMLISKKFRRAMSRAGTTDQRRRSDRWRYADSTAVWHTGICLHKRRS